MSNTLLSVCMITYNHEQYIKEAIEGVLSQIVDFEIELIVADDCSPDHTKKVVEELIQNHPNGNWIKYTRHSENKGMRLNFSWALQQCKGKYIAVCEGDDYWTDPLKLQKQVGFLEQTPGYSACFHQTIIVHQDLNYNKVDLFSKGLMKNRFTFDDVIERWFISTCSLLFVNFLKDNPNHLYLSSPLFFSDRPLEAFLAKMGDFYFIDDVMSCYRDHSQGITKIGNQSLMSYEGAMACVELTKIFPESEIILSEQVIRWGMLAAESSYKNKEYLFFVKYVFFSFRHIKSKLGLKNFIKSKFQILVNKKIYA